MYANLPEINFPDCWYSKNSVYIIDAKLRWLPPRMRLIHVAVCTALIAAFTLPLGAQGDPAGSSDLTVVLDFKGTWSRNAVTEMEREAALILKPSGIRPSWRFGKHPPVVSPQIAVIVFRGSCEFDFMQSGNASDGPLAFTWISDGQVLPFGEVNCNKVVSAVQNALAGRSAAAGEQLVGRALGRVVAHELVHILTRSVQHGTDGVQKPSLSGQELIQPDLALAAEDVNLLRHERADRPN